MESLDGTLLIWLALTIGTLLLLLRRSAPMLIRTVAGMMYVYFVYKLFYHVISPDPDNVILSAQIAGYSICFAGIIYYLGYLISIPDHNKRLPPPLDGSHEQL